MNRLIFSLPMSTNKSTKSSTLGVLVSSRTRDIRNTSIGLQCARTIFASICNTWNYENSRSLSNPQRSAWMCYHIHVIIISFFICPLSVELLGGWGWYVNRPIHVALCKEVCETDFLADNIQTNICHGSKNIGHHLDNRWDQFLFFCSDLFFYV